MSDDPRQQEREQLARSGYTRWPKRARRRKAAPTPPHDGICSLCDRPITRQQSYMDGPRRHVVCPTTPATPTTPKEA